MQEHIALTPEQYAKYLRSPSWKMTRELTLAERGANCEQCGSDDHLQIHHKTYRNLGKEKIEDLQVLCRDCHRHKGHGHLKRKPELTPKSECAMTLDDASKSLNVSRATVRQWVKKGKLRAFQLWGKGGHWRFWPEAIRERKEEMRKTRNGRAILDPTRETTSGAG